MIDLLEHIGMIKNKYKSYLGTWDLKLKFSRHCGTQESEHQGPHFCVPIISGLAPLGHNLKAHITSYT